MKILGVNYAFLLLTAIIMIIFGSIDTSVNAAPDKRCGPNRVWDPSGSCKPVLVIIHTFVNIFLSGKSRKIEILFFFKYKTIWVISRKHFF